MLFLLYLRPKKASDSAKKNGFQHRPASATGTVTTHNTGKLAADQHCGGYSDDPNTCKLAADQHCGGYSDDPQHR